MTFVGLLWRNLLYHRRGNLAVLLGVAVGTAVLAGALLVGDSLRGSLRELTEQRLGWVDQALIAGRFFRTELADELEKRGAERVAPVLMLRATARLSGGKKDLPVRRINLFGVDERFWGSEPTPGGPRFQRGSVERVVYLNETLARALGVSEREEVAFNFEKRSAIPSESLLGQRDQDETVAHITLTVGGVLPEDQFGSRFNLSPLPEAPRNAFVPLRTLQEQLAAAGAKGHKVNALLASGVPVDLGRVLKETLKLDDWNLVLKSPASRARALVEPGEAGLRRSEQRSKLPTVVLRAIQPKQPGLVTTEELTEYYRTHHPYLSLESGQLLLENAVADAALDAARDVGLRAAPTLVYLANSISDGKKSIPYSVVAALDPTQKPPLGPFLPEGVNNLADGDIVLTTWEQSPLEAKPGADITLSYFEPVHQGKPVEKTTPPFHLAGFLPLQGPAADPNLAPEFPGITDKAEMSRWEKPFEGYDPKRIESRDDRYWQDYRTTPKAYVTLKRGQELWSSRFGKRTSIRLAPESGERPPAVDLEKKADEFRAALRKRLSPAQGGFVFAPVKQEGLAASTGAFDFGMLFLGFSFFLILAALLLVGLLFRLNLDRRASEVGLLLAAGARRATVRWLLLGEGMLLATIGSLVGLAGGVVYAGFLLRYLRSTWPGRSELAFLRLHVEPLSLVIGFLASVAVSVLTIAWAVRVLGRAAPRSLLQGQTTDEGTPGTPPRLRLRLGICLGSLMVGIVLLVAGGFVKEPEARAGTFFGSGALLLTAGLTGLSAWMGSSRHQTVAGHGAAAVGRLGVRNAARHPSRSLLTAGLLAAAAFLLVAVECFRRQAGADFFQQDAGSGGYPLLAESDLPVLFDLSTDRGREQVLNNVERHYQVRSPGEEGKKRAAAERLLKEADIVSFRVKEGDDASCLNLYQPRRPRLLGVPARLIDDGGFAFGAAKADTSEEKKNPWLLLLRSMDGVPVFGDQETVTWQLKLGLGAGLEVPDAGGQPRTLRVVGLLHDSVFQSSLLLSEENFLHLYPEHQGYNFFLIRPGEPVQADELKEVLEIGLAVQGLEVTPTAERLESYLAVRNMYLSTFQALGGMGLLLGTLGLAVVLLRSVWERRGELALLRALGYRRGTLSWLVLAENSFLLLLGLGLGTLTALAAVFPHVLGSGGHVEWLGLLGMLGLSLAVGLVASTLATASVTRAALVPALRRE